MLRASLTAAVLLLGCLVGSPAAAAVECQQYDSRTGACFVYAAGGGSDSSTRPVSSTGSQGGTTSCTYLGESIPCTSGPGVWSASKSCYVSLADPQPSQENPVWEGHTDGAVYVCSPPVGMPGTATGSFWAPFNPVGGPSPRALADQAVEAMNLRAGLIGIVPEPGPDKVGIVGMPVWLWIADPGESTTGPITRTASGGGITVSATARLDRVVWSMGDGSTVACADAGARGTAYEDSFDRAPSPTCGHTYGRMSDDQPGDSYTVTATSSWTVTWSGGGASGTIPLSFSRSTQIRVGEIQVLVTG